MPRCQRERPVPFDRLSRPVIRTETGVAQLDERLALQAEDAEQLVGQFSRHEPHVVKEHLALGLALRVWTGPQDREDAPRPARTKLAPARRVAPSSTGATNDSTRWETSSLMTAPSRRVSELNLSQVEPSFIRRELRVGMKHAPVEPGIDRVDAQPPVGDAQHDRRLGSAACRRGRASRSGRQFRRRSDPSRSRANGSLGSFRRAATAANCR